MSEAGTATPNWRREFIASLTVTVLCIPQCLAYAMIAGLPPVVGLYAATLPKIIGSVLRSSRHVMTGPSNALSLLIGGATAAFAGTQGATPMEIGFTLAFMVGLIQVGAALLRMGSVVDFISSSVVLGYITGAAALIAVGQLDALTGTEMESGTLVQQVSSWVEGLGTLHPITLGLGLGTTIFIATLRWINRRLPAALIAVIVCGFLSWSLDLSAMGVTIVGDVAPVPAGLPPLTMPRFELMEFLLPVAIAGAVLSLVESTSVGRAIAGKTGDSVDSFREFMGQGMSNLTAAFCGGYPISGSLSRTNLNYLSGGQTRWVGICTGGLVLVTVLVAGPLVDVVPLSCLAGLLMVVAYDLLNVDQIRRTMKARPADYVAFLATMFGTWTLSLDTAIYLGMGISIVMFLRRARMLIVEELVVDNEGRLVEVGTPEAGEPDGIRVLQVEGALFFGASSVLRSTLEGYLSDKSTRVFIVRIKHAIGMDMSIMDELSSTAERLRRQGRHLLLVGMREEQQDLFDRTGATERMGSDHLFPHQLGWFAAMDEAFASARALRDAGAAD